MEVEKVWRSWSRRLESEGRPILRAAIFMIESDSKGLRKLDMDRRVVQNYEHDY